MNRSLALLLAAIALCAVVPAHAYVTESTKWNPSSLPIPYRVNTGSIPSEISGTGVGSVDGGFTTWAGPACTSWRASDAGSTTASANASDRQNVILWLSGGWPSDLGDPSSVIGVTTPVWTVGGYFNDADIRFNNVGFTWSTTGTGGTVDTQSIATHEEGHFLGLDHTPTRGAIMYASYSMGLVRTLSSDDQAGVCFLYPSGVAPMDAGTPPPRDAGSTGSDPCNVHGTTCDGCTPYGGCGFCGASGSCISGTGTSAPAACSSGWVWYPMDCTGTTGGTGRFGDPCTGPTDCGSGAPCVAPPGGAAFCSQACSDDCTCPGGYSCFMTSTPGLSVCAPGTNMCATPPPVDAGGPPPPVDSGTTPPPVDSGSTPPGDSGSTPLDDGGSPPIDGSIGLDLGTGGHHTRTGGCCSVPGTGSVTTESGLASLFFVAVLGVVRIRRRVSR